MLATVSYDLFGPRAITPLSQTIVIEAGADRQCLLEIKIMTGEDKGRRLKDRIKHGGREGYTYFANALPSAFLQDTFCAPTKESTVTAMARSTSCEVQYSLRRILQNASEIRMMASRWRTCMLTSAKPLTTQSFLFSPKPDAKKRR